VTDRLTKSQRIEQDTLQDRGRRLIADIVDSGLPQSEKNDVLRELAAEAEDADGDSE